MRVSKTKIKDCYIIEYDKYFDERGHFSVPFNVDYFNNQTGLDFQIVQ